MDKDKNINNGRGIHDHTRIYRKQAYFLLLHINHQTSIIYTAALPVFFFTFIIFFTFFIVVPNTKILFTSFFTLAFLNYRLKPFLTNPSLVDVVMEETSLLHPTLPPPLVVQLTMQRECVYPK